MKRFEGKTVLVLGGNSGIGLASVSQFVAEGAKVHFTGRDQTTIDAAMKDVPGTIGHRADVTDTGAMKALFDTLKADAVKIDVLFVNAGVGGFAPLPEIEPSHWDHVHDVNLKGCVFAIQQALPLLAKDANIVVTGSIGAHSALPGNAMYAAAKGGLAAALKVIAAELVGEGIRVNLVSPGPIETPLLYRNPGVVEEQVEELRGKMIASVPMGRMGRAEEVADAVLFLASSQASFITGANLCVDGGSLELR